MGWCGKLAAMALGAALFCAAQLAPAQVPGTVPAAMGGAAASPALPRDTVPLPALPLPVGSRVMVLGDSEAGYNHGTQGPGDAAFTFADGLFAVAWGDLANFDFDTWADPQAPWSASGQSRLDGANQGVAGDHLDWSRPRFGNGVFHRVAYAASRNPGIVWINAGTNTINSGDANGEPGCGGGTGSGFVPPSAAYVTGKLDTIVGQFTSRGIWVILTTLYPRGDWPAGDARHEVLHGVNAWILAQAGRPGVRVMDAHAVLADGEGRPAAGYFREGAAGVHLNQAGAWAVYSAVLKPILTAMIAPGTTFNQDAAAANLYPADMALMQGGTGGVKGAGITGAVPAGFSLTMARGTSTANAAIEDAGSYKRAVFSVFPVNDGYAHAFHEADLTFPPLTSGLPSAGDWVKAWVHVETPGAPGPSAVTFSLGIFNGAAQVLNPKGQGTYSSYFAVPAPGRGAYWIEVPPFRWPEAGGKLQAMVQVLFPKAMASGFTVKIDRPILRVVSDPRAAWNLP